MNFTSLDFLLFLPATLLLCRLFPARFRWPLLLAASYFFYMRYTPWVGLLLFGATFVSWFCAGKIAVAHEGDSITRTAKMTAHENDATYGSRHANMRTMTSKHSRPGKRFWLTLGIATPLACLFIFKYMGFLGQIIESVFGLFFGKPKIPYGVNPQASHGTFCYRPESHFTRSRRCPTSSTSTERT